MFESSGWGGGAKVSWNIYAGFTWKKSLIIYHLCRPSWNPQGKDLRTCEMYHPRIQMRLIMFDPRDIMASSVACFSASSLSFACLRRCWKYILYWVVGGCKINNNTLCSMLARKRQDLICTSTASNKSKLRGSCGIARKVLPKHHW